MKNTQWKAEDIQRLAESKDDDPFTFPFPEVSNPWEKAAEMATEFDDNMCKAWMEEIQNLLVFAGLFSSVVTAFAVEAQKLLQPDARTASVMLLTQISAKINNNTVVAPDIFNISPKTSQRINALIFTSLVLSLGTAFIGIIVLQWICSYREYEPMPHQRCICARSLHYKGLLVWKIPEIVSVLPVVLQIALAIFFAGLLDLLHSLALVVAIIVGSVIGTILGFVIFTTVAPSLYMLLAGVLSAVFPKRRDDDSEYAPIPAYQSPQSWLLFRLLALLFPVYKPANVTNSIGCAGYFLFF
ncbi:hypothetical protein CVT24_010877, partial [Panaeolus cyanescens]